MVMVIVIVFRKKYKTLRGENSRRYYGAVYQRDIPFANTIVTVLLTNQKGKTEMFLEAFENSSAHACEISSYQ